tara:strand:+ start:68 stop:262 length:195 start_codon:yes stop_codon:yes gene_type:complete
MTEDEFKKADELHMEGKAVIGLVAFVLLIIIGIAWMSYESGAMDTDYRQLYFDGPINTEVENLA